MRSGSAGLPTAAALLVALGGAACGPRPVDAGAYRAAREALVAHLDGEVLPFWASAALFDAGQGFVRLLDRELRPAGGISRDLIPQLRALYVHAVAARRAADPADRARIERQRDAILDRIAGYWDDGRGGFADRLGEDLRPAPGPGSTRIQAHAIHLLAEAYRHGAPPEALHLARRAFEAVEANAAEGAGRGYREAWGRPPGEPGAEGRRATTSLHLLLGVARLEQVAPAPDQRRRLEALLSEAQRFEIQGSGWIAETLAGDGSPRPGAAGAEAAEARPEAAEARPEAAEARPETVFPHAAELLGAALVAARVLGRDPADLGPWLGRVATTQRVHGIDAAGGVRHRSLWQGPVLDARRFWWSQAEMLAMLLAVHELRREPAFWEAFERVRGFTFEAMVPPGSGAWVSTLDERGRRVDGMIWQTGYHVTHALLECEASLDRLLGPPPS